MQTPFENKIEEANQRAAQAMINAQPIWVDVRPAFEVIPGMTQDLVLHSGPPVTWDWMLDGQKGAIIGALLFEGLASSEEDAEHKLARGEIHLGSAHDHQATGPGSGAISAHMPVFVVRDASSGREAYCTIAELNLVFGRYDQQAVEGIRYLRDELGPILQTVVRQLGGVEIKPLVKKALLMGDETHDRSEAATNVLALHLAPALVRSGLEPERVARTFEYMQTTELFFFTFLNMAACKVITQAAEGIEGSSVVTVLAGNGTDYGIKVAGLGNRWFTGPAPVITGGTFFEGFTQQDAAPEQGDSIVIETAGLGGFSLAASPAHARAAGATLQDAVRYTQEMWQITVTRNAEFEIPYLDFAGAPTGVDVLKVVRTGIPPIHAAGIGHKKRGQGFIGLGMGYAPMEPFQKVAEEFEQLSSQA